MEKTENTQSMTQIATQQTEAQIKRASAFNSNLAHLGNDVAGVWFSNEDKLTMTWKEPQGQIVEDLYFDKVT